MAFHQTFLGSSWGADPYSASARPVGLCYAPMTSQRVGYRRGLDLPEDLLAWVAKVYRDRAGEVFDSLTFLCAECASFATDRVLWCIAQAVDGRASNIKRYVVLAKDDWRDVITTAGYQYPDVRLPDLSKPFEL